MTLLYPDHDPVRVEVLFEEHSSGFLQPLDLRVNARVRHRKHSLELIPESKKNTYQGGRLAFYPQGEERP